MATLQLDEELVRIALYELYDPEFGDNVVDLGLVYNVEVSGRDVRVTMTLPPSGGTLSGRLSAAVDQAVRLFAPDAGTIAVTLAWDPPWTPAMRTPADRRERGWCDERGPHKD